MLREKVMPCKAGWTASKRSYQLTTQELLNWRALAHHQVGFLLMTSLDWNWEIVLILPTLSLGGQSHEHHRTGIRHRLHSTLLPYFNGEDTADEGAFDRWVRKLERCAVVDGWSDREQLLQLGST